MPFSLSPAEIASVLDIADIPERLKTVDRSVSKAMREFRKVLGDDLVMSIAAPSKRIRATLAIACAELGGTFDRDVVAAATAIELVQIGSLIHDDVLEDAPTRRGKPTLNASRGVPVALVVGDLVLARAGTLAAELGTQPAEFLSRSMAEMCIGQLAELHDAFNLERTREAYLASVRAKTGALFAAACRLGGMRAGFTGKRLGALTAYGGAFGVLYQFVDDLLDLVGDPKRLGKPVGVDIPAGVYTLPVLTALKLRGGKALARLLRRRDVRSLEEATRRILGSGAIEDAVFAIHALAAEAARTLRPFATEPVGRGLQRFPRYYADWALRELRAERWSGGEGAESGKATRKPAKRKPAKRKPAKRKPPQGRRQAP